MGENNEETLEEKISEELRILPVKRFEIIKYLTKFITNVSAHSDVNGMTLINLVWKGKITFIAKTKSLRDL